MPAAAKESWLVSHKTLPKGENNDYSTRKRSAQSQIKGYYIMFIIFCAHTYFAYFVHDLKKIALLTSCYVYAYIQEINHTPCISKLTSMFWIKYGFWIYRKHNRHMDTLDFSCKLKLFHSDCVIMLVCVYMHISLQ